ncbi:hypothetical protein [Streptococcus didelphis]|uniref:hypothetical protein n=1 Tax=Streptococcus didelphis TaxID=102886 RepID=UPI003523CCDC
MAAMFGSSLALSISDIPFNGPIAGVQVGYIDGQFIINPDKEQLDASLLELTVAGSKEAINMVESGAKELSEDIMLEALLKGHQAIQELIAFQEEIVAAVGKEKTEVELLRVDEQLQAEILAKYNSDLQKAVQVEEKKHVKLQQRKLKKLLKQNMKNTMQKMRTCQLLCVTWQKYLNEWSMQRFAA